MARTDCDGVGERAANSTTVVQSTLLRAGDGSRSGDFGVAAIGSEGIRPIGGESGKLISGAASSRMRR
jgi:hypothetical protein